MDGLWWIVWRCLESLPLKLQSILSWLVNIMVPTKIAGFFFWLVDYHPLFPLQSIFFWQSFIMFHPWVFSSSNHQMLKKNPPTFTHDITQILVSTHRGICTQQDLESGLSSASVPRWVEPNPLAAVPMKNAETCRDMPRNLNGEVDLGISNVINSIMNHPQYYNN